MNEYILAYIENSNYNWIVIATSYISPIMLLDRISKEIRNSSGHVLFDLALINGVERNRYIAADIIDGRFDRSSFRTVNEISDNITNISRNFFVNNPDIVDNGIIPRSLKYLLKEGCV